MATDITKTITDASPAEREEMMKALLGDQYDALMVLKAKSQTKEQRKAVKSRANQLLGRVKDVEGEKEFVEPYNTARSEMTTIVDKALVRAGSLIEQEEAKKAA